MSQGFVNKVVSVPAATQAGQEAAASTETFVSPGVQQFHPSSAKAWVQFDGTGTVAIDSSFNVSSITDNGVGTYVVNFTTAFSSAEYCASGISRSDGASTGFIVMQNNISAAAGTYPAVTLDTSGGAKDSSRVCLAFWGDQV